MKNLMIFIGGIILLGMIASAPLKALKNETVLPGIHINAKKDIHTDSIWVNGVCNMCKNRIENAALIKGVKKAKWNKYAHILVVIYDANVTNTDAISKAVAEAGHDTKKYKAKDEVYHKLPKCCAYREPGATTH